ncbi:MAG: heparinase II/III-family protein, partial [Muribaculaceae bacterium]|nr:heparinase II/III-family protein [Muribaculaceae bacterium]
LYSINFGDSHKNVTGESSMSLAYAMGVKDPVTLWYITQLEPNQHREGFPMNYPMGFLYLPDVKNAPKLPDLPTSHLWKDFGWATMRDSWKKNATMLAVKSGMTWNHAHADANSLILFHKGVDIIKDAGNCSYGKPEYRNYFFQSEAHNVVKFNGQGQPRAQQYHGSPLPGNVSSLLDAGNVKYVMANGTGPMSRWFSRNLRHYLWIGDVIYIVDDIVSHEPGHFEWLWHPGGEVKKRGGDLEITSGESSVVLRPLYPEPLAPSNFVHDYPDMLWWEVIDAPKETLDGTEQYYSLHLPKVTDRVKGVTAIILKDNPDRKELPKMTRIEGKDWIGVRSVFGGKVTDLYINQLADGRLMHLNSWIDADGWTTDSYMLAVTYDEGVDPAKSSEVTLIHGGTLKRDGHIYHSSRTKGNIVGKVSGGKFKPLATDVPFKR